MSREHIGASLMRIPETHEGNVHYFFYTQQVIILQESGIRLSPVNVPPNTPCSRPRWRGIELGASRGRKLRRSVAIYLAGVIVALNTIIPPLDGEHPQFAGAA